MNREDFPILKETVYGKPLVYLDNAATSQKPQVVIDAIADAYSHWNANIHRGIHYLSQVATRKHEEARHTVASFLNAAQPEEIVFTKGATDSLNMLAFSFGEKYIKKGDEIVVSQLEHHSNVVPWQMLCERKQAVLRVVRLDDNLAFDVEHYRSLLNERTRLVSVAHVSNVLGTINPVKEIIRLAHEKNIPVCIDGAQSAPHLPIDVQEMDCDFFVCSAHKMYGPTGVGILYGKRQWLDILPPAEGGGEMIEHVSFEHTTFNVLPYKFEAGTPDFVGSFAFAEALNYLRQIEMKNVGEIEEKLTLYAEKRLTEIPDICIYAAGQPKAGVISFNVGNIHPMDIGMLLDKQGVAVRTGHHCAEPLIDFLGAPGTIRVSFGLYNTIEEVDIFIDALKKAVSMLA